MEIAREVVAPAGWIGRDGHQSWWRRGPQFPHADGMPNTITPRLQYSSTAVRPRWADLPRDVRRLVSRRLGGAVGAGPNAGSGFTSGFAAVLHGANGPEFVKAVNAKGNAVIADRYQQEALINHALPTVMRIPRLWRAAMYQALAGSSWYIDGGYALE